jgi:hypothetical protein
MNEISVLGVLSDYGIFGDRFSFLSLELREDHMCPASKLDNLLEENHFFKEHFREEFFDRPSFLKRVAQAIREI